MRIIATGAFDCRLTAVFDDEAGLVDLDEGRLICEPVPRYLSHISIVPEGEVEFELGFTIVNKDVVYAY